MRALWIVVAILLTGCSVSVERMPPPGPKPAAQAPAAQPQGGRQAERQFVEVVRRMEPVAERICRLERGGNCDFLIVVDTRRNQPPNAFQTVDRSGRPVLGFNMGLINSVRNADEMAFVVGHEAAHHIARHLDRQKQNAALGAAVFGEAASAVFGSSADAVRAGQELGAVLGARSFSKDFELEADALGTVITARAGYDPVRGSAFFTQLPDPGNRFLGTHPPNAAREETVRRVAASLRR